MDPICGHYPDTTDADPWPVLRLAPGVYDCLSFSEPGIWRRVNLRGPRPVCSHPFWHGERCRHIRTVAAQADAIEAALQAQQAA